MSDRQKEIPTEHQVQLMERWMQIVLDRLEEHEDRFKILEAKTHRLVANANSGPKGMVV